MQDMCASPHRRLLESSVNFTFIKVDKTVLTVFGKVVVANQELPNS